MENIEEKEITVDTFACINCGADLKYKPGTETLNCDYCDTVNEIPKLEGSIEEFNFNEFLKKQNTSENTISERFAKCDNCGASSSLDTHTTATNCPYCTTPLLVEKAQEENIIEPKSLLPFKLSKNEAQIEFKKWIDKLWFAPDNLKKAVLNFDHFKGIYVPYWTFDTNTVTNYVGQRGKHYYVSQNYTTTVNGKTVTKTRRVRKTRWYTTSGSVANIFDDILTIATKSLPKKYAYNLEPWDLENLIPYDKSYLSGFISEKYQVELEEGFEIAKTIANPKIRNSVRRNIGGDEQRILSMNTHYNDITFKHLLLPIYASAYRFENKTYLFLVNGRTGEVQGQRPYSWFKIVLAIIFVLIIITSIAYFSS